jgi:hypothetical protein
LNIYLLKELAGVLNIELSQELDFILKSQEEGSFAALVTLLESTAIDVHAEPKHIVHTQNNLQRMVHACNTWCMNGCAYACALAVNNPPRKDRRLPRLPQFGRDKN